MSLSIVVGEPAGLDPCLDFTKELLDLFVREKAPMTIDDLPPLALFFQADASLVVDGKVHAVAVMLGDG